MNARLIVTAAVSGGLVGVSVAEYLKVRSQEQKKREQIRLDASRQSFAIAFAAGTVCERLKRGYPYKSHQDVLDDLECEKIDYLETHE